MPDRQEWLAGVPCWVDTSQPDPEAATDFYGGLFGWEFEDRMPEGSDGRYFVASMGGRTVAAVGSQMDAAAPRRPGRMYVATDDADATAAKVRDAGGTVLAGPFDVADAGRMAVFADPSGAAFAGWQAGRTKGVEAVNEHGSWNFSGLNTPDPAGAEAFYGAVFGWELSPFGDGSGSGYWRRPGYGDFLERNDPGIRQRNTELGAPDRFEDAVATLQPPEGGRRRTGARRSPWTTPTPPRTGRRKLGGTVVVPPTDAPWVRSRCCGTRRARRSSSASSCRPADRDGLPPGHGRDRQDDEPVAKTSMAAHRRLEPLYHVVDLVAMIDDRRHHLQRRPAVEGEDGQDAVGEALPRQLGALGVGAGRPAPHQAEPAVPGQPVRMAGRLSRRRPRRKRSPMASTCPGRPRPGSARPPPRRSARRAGSRRSRRAEERCSAKWASTPRRSSRRRSEHTRARPSPVTSTSGTTPSARMRRAARAGRCGRTPEGAAAVMASPRPRHVPLEAK